jgi:hypothetical protein
LSKHHFSSREEPVISKPDIEKQEGFGNFGGPYIVSLAPEVSTRALKAQWLQKWFVHRRLRPEAFVGLIHHHKKVMQVILFLRCQFLILQF